MTPSTAHARCQRRECPALTGRGVPGEEHLYPGGTSPGATWAPTGPAHSPAERRATPMNPHPPPPGKGQANPALRFTSTLRQGPFGLGPMTRVLGQRRPLQNPPIAPPRQQMSRLTSVTGAASVVGLEAQCVSEKPTGMGDLPAAMSKGRVKSWSVESKDAAGAFRLSQGVWPHSRCACPQGVRRTGKAWAHGSGCVGPRFDRPHASTGTAR